MRITSIRTSIDVSLKKAVSLESSQGEVVERFLSMIVPSRPYVWIGIRSINEEDVNISFTERGDTNWIVVRINTMRHGEGKHNAVQPSRVVTRHPTRYNHELVSYYSPSQSDLAIGDLSR